MNRGRLYNRWIIICALCLAMQAFAQPKDNTNPLFMNSRNLPPCPDSPNCVSSQALDDNHFVEPLHFTGSGRTALQILTETIRNLPDTRILESGETRLHAEFRTRWLKFTDDFEAILDEQHAVIHIRSASRVGYWDLGTNRRRIETIRGLMNSRIE
ncbi:MAG: DUF1499 domain-containing protein [Gammaproteobacteria bacterium]